MFEGLEEIEIVEPIFKIKRIESVKTTSIQKENGTRWTPNDPLYSANQWHFNNTGQDIGQVGTVGWDCNAEVAWDIETGNPNFIVAIIDGGVDFTHEDIAANMWPTIGPDGASTVADDHGTHVAGTISALNNNSVGVSGLAGGDGSGNGTKIMSIDLFNGSHGLSTLGMNQYAADNGASISQNSWGYGSAGAYNQSDLDGIDYFNANGGGTGLNGGITIFAAGNDNDNGDWYPGYYGYGDAGTMGAMAVASHDNQGVKSSFSNYGVWVDITAPGTNIASLEPNDSYAFMSGTSMACPHVSGVAAMIVSNTEGVLTNAELWTIIVNSVRTDLYDQNGGYTGELGIGALDAVAALIEAQTYLGGVPRADNLSATTVSSSEIALTWDLNVEGDDVIIAFATEGNSIGDPVDGTVYTVGNTLPGGGEIMYVGGATSTNHTGLNSATKYNYEVWAQAGADRQDAQGDWYQKDDYSTSKSATATTDCAPYTAFPLTETFEGGTLPICWSYEGSDWAYQDGGRSGRPAAAHGGSFNAYFNAAADVSKLVSPQLDFTGATDATLTFWHAQDKSGGKQDELRVYYKTSSGGAWTLLNAYTADIGAWTERTITLPDLTSDYYIAFEATAEGGFGVVVDDIGISATFGTTPLLYTTESAIDFGDISLGYYSERNYDVSGLNLTGDVTITAPADFEISLTAGSGYTNPIVLSPSGGTLAATTIYVKFAPGAVQAYSGVITNVSSGATQIDIALTGNGVNWFPPPINLVGILNGVDADLTWDAPSTTNGAAAGWNFYSEIANANRYLDSDFTIKGSYYESADFSYDYPIKITELRHAFYDAGVAGGGASTWTDATFKFIILAEDLSTLLYESPEIEAVNLTAIAHVIPDGIILTSDFFMGVQTIAADGTPSTLAELMPDNNYHSYLYDGTDWFYWSDGTNAKDICQGFFIDGTKGQEYVGNTINYEKIENITNKFTDKSKTIDNPNKGTRSSLTGYQVYKDGIAIGGQIPSTQTTYTDLDICGSHTYTVTAIYSGYDGESGSSNSDIVEISATVITIQPTGNTICDGDDHTFTISATGYGTLTYQWYKEASAIGGATSASYAITGAAIGDAGNYSCQVSGCDVVSSNSVTLNVNVSTAISTQPTGNTICVGDNHTFTVVATGSTLSYQWQKDASDISGATSASYTVSTGTTGDAGAYTCDVSGDCGDVTSTSVTLTVNENTAISTQPTGNTICEGDNHTFTVVASGSTLSYQWYKGASAIGSATSASYTITGATTGDAANYSCQISGDCGNITSSSVALNVNASTAISTQPTGNTICEGDNHTFTVVATGSTLSYQWQKGGVDIGSATSASYTVSTATTGDAGSYTCDVFGDCGDVTTTSVTLNVNEGTAISTQPSGNTICEGDDYTFTVVATGSTLSYQWYKGASAIGGATSASYAITGATTGDAANYSCQISGDCGNVTSSSATLNVNAGTTITDESTSQTACLTSNVTFFVTVTGSGLSYQWLFNGSDIGGATSDTYDLTNVDNADAGTYTCNITGDCGNPTSSSMVLTITASLTLGDPTDENVCSGSTATFTVVANGTGLGYQWQFNGSDISNGGDISGANSATLSIANSDGANVGNYTCDVTSGCGDASSNVASLSLNTATAIGTQPSNEEVCEGDNVTFSVSATGSGLTYQWFNEGSSISGANSADYTITGVILANAGNYTCDVIGDCGTVTSSTAVLTVNEDIAITTQPTGNTLCEGENITFSVVATGTGLTYQWQYNGSDIGSANSANYTITGIVSGDAGSYTCDVTGTCGNITSNTATLIASPATAITTQPTDQSACTGGDATFTIVVDNATSYQWQFNGSDISGATSASLFLAGVTAGNVGNYTCNITGICGDITSDVVTLTVVDGTEITAQPTGNTLCEGENITFSIVANGSGLNYQWQFNGSDISGATSADYTITGIVSGYAGSYTCDVTGDCGNITSDVATLTVNLLTAITTQPTDQSACDGGDATFTVVADNATSYQWQFNGSDISGATSASLFLAGVTATDIGDYTCIITGDCGDITSDVVTLTVVDGASISTQPNSATVCVDGNVTFSIVAEGSGLTYQWQFNGSDITGANSADYTINGAIADDAGSYTCNISSDCGATTSDAAILTVNQSTVITDHPIDVSATVGDNVSFSVVADGDNLIYQWKFEGTDIDGAEDATYQILSVTMDDAGNYSVAVSGTCGEIVSDNALLSVTTSIEELTEMGVNIYPNPTTGLLNIKLSENAENTEIIITDVTGKIVHQGNILGQEATINLDVATGVYLIRFNFDEKSVISTIIVE